MSREYVENRIKEALKKSKGNKLLARQQLIAWTYEDSKLLHALTRAHLDGIIAYNIDRFLSNAIKANSKKKAQGAAAAQDEPVEDQFGMDILRAVSASDAAVFGFEDSSPRRPKGKTSKQHIDALQKMAASVQKSVQKKNKDTE